MEKKDVYLLLKNNPYPGRGIILGRSLDGTKAVLAYFIMGRSENSRNRVFIETEDGLKTQAFDPSKMTDPMLVIYNPVRRLDIDDIERTDGRKGSLQRCPSAPCNAGVAKHGNIERADGRNESSLRNHFAPGYAGTAKHGKTTFIVTNGDQTDTIRDYLAGGKSYIEALMTREFEPDAPNFTPRISGLIFPCGSYILSILKTMDSDPGCCLRHFFTYDAPLPGVGHFIHTYTGDGNPLPSFEGEPVCIAIDYGYREFAEKIWEAMDGDNKVSLYVSEIDIETGKFESVIINKY